MLSSYFRSSINQPPEITTIQFNTCVEERKKKHDCLLAVIETCADFASLYVLLLVLFLFSFFFFFSACFRCWNPMHDLRCRCMHEISKRVKKAD